MIIGTDRLTGQLGNIAELDLEQGIRQAALLVQEAAKLGFHTCILPASSAAGIKKAPDGMKLIPIRGIGQLSDYLAGC